MLNMSQPDQESVVVPVMKTTIGDPYRYKKSTIINQGTYGAVYLCTDVEKKELVAVKHEFYGFCKSTARELDILKSLSPHPNIVEFKDFVVDTKDRVFVVMEYLPMDLNKFMGSKKSPCAMSEVKSITKQILQGVDFLHRNGIMHRDLKPSNILMNRRGQLKICDFGLSRTTDCSGAYSPGVGTLRYRAPELLFNSEWYGEAVDIWSAGCIMPEVAVKMVLFPGASEIQQLNYIMSKSAPSRIRQRLTAAAAAAGAPCLSALGFDLLEQLLCFDPESRITSTAALLHPWFNEE